MIRVDVAGHLSARQRLMLISLPPAKRKRLLGQIGRKIIVATRRRLRTQTDLQGHAWQKRKNGNKKMLRKISQKLIAVGHERKITVTLKNAASAKIANRHQAGITEIFTAEKAKRLRGEPDYSGPCTKTQAKSLTAAGFKVRRHNGKGWKRATQKWIKEHLTLGQAGIILRKMRDTESKRRWEIPLPARSFLGATQTEIQEITQLIFNQTIRARSHAR